MRFKIPTLAIAALLSLGATACKSNTGDTGDTSMGGDTSSGDTSSGDTSSGDTSSGDTSSGDTSSS